jgi:chromate transporter
LGGLAGVWLCRNGVGSGGGGLVSPVSRRAGFVALGLLFTLLFGLPIALAAGAPGNLAVFEAFTRSGALVFGGGHVVLPLLRETFVRPGWIGDDAFLAGYGAAQAVPGPLFSFAAYLGAIAKNGPGGLAGAALGLVGLFLPGILALVGALPFWGAYRARPGAQAAMRGVNAAVVGILGAALYNPVWSATVRGPADVAIALAGLVLLSAWKAPPLLVVAMSAVGGLLAMPIGG